jgi:hypothetical protein
MLTVVALQAKPLDNPTSVLPMVAFWQSCPASLRFISRWSLSLWLARLSEIAGIIQQSENNVGCVSYVMNDTAKLLEAEGVLADNTKDIIRSFAMQRSGRKEIKQPVGHIPLSFAPEDKERMTDNFMVQLAKDVYIENMTNKDRKTLFSSYVFLNDEKDKAFSSNKKPDDFVKYGQYEMRIRDKMLIEAGYMTKAAVKWWGGGYAHPYLWKENKSDAEYRESWGAQDCRKLRKRSRRFKRKIGGGRGKECSFLGDDTCRIKIKKKLFQ